MRLHSITSSARASANYLIDNKAGIIIDAEGTGANRTMEITVAQTMVERVSRYFELWTQRLAGDTVYGAVRLLKWLVDRKITPHVPVWDKSARHDGTFNRTDFVSTSPAWLERCQGRGPAHRNRVPAGRVSDEIVHGVDLFPTLASIVGAVMPKDRPIDGVDQSSFFTGKTEKSGREGILIWCAERLQAVKWRNFKVHFYQQETMVSPPIKLAIPLLFNLYTNPREEADKVITDSWVFGPVLKMVGEFEASVKKNPLIAMGAPDPYMPPR